MGFTVAQTSAKFIPGYSNIEETNSIQATTPDLGLVGIWRKYLQR